MTPAVLLIIFKRPDTTQQVFDAVRAAMPTILYVAADGPREDREGEAELCEQVRKIATAVDWPCRVELKLREKNVGIKRNVSEAISWFLATENEGIILEDDCCPSPDFFDFASAMLRKYQNDPRIYHISGSCFQPVRRGESSYYFSKYNHGWGWATWRRAWDKCDLEMKSIDPFLANAVARGVWDSKKEQKYWTQIFRQQADGLIDTWDYQWKFTLWRDGAFAIYPNANMVSNLGFNDQGTNTVSHDAGKAERGWEKAVRGGEAGNEWLHPALFVRNVQADAWTFQNLYWGLPLDRLKAKVRKLVGLLTGRK